MKKEDLMAEIKRLKEEKQALILAHYYVEGEIQEVADYVGDSYYLSKLCKERPEKTIIFCGVKFMGESAKILNPDKTIIMPDKYADCPMAHMIQVNKIKAARKKYSDLAVVCYINSTADIKAYSDVIVTSSNAYNIIGKLEQKNILFIPDEHLGRYISKKFPDKKFIFNDGFCHVHTSITQTQLKKAMEEHPEAKVVVHPECKLEIAKLGDYVGSTLGIISYVTKSENSEFIVCTEKGILHQLQKANPDKTFYLVNDKQVCPNMKRITLEEIYDALANETTGIEVNENIAREAEHALLKMHELGN